MKKKIENTPVNPLETIKTIKSLVSAKYFNVRAFKTKHVIKTVLGKLFKRPVAKPAPTVLPKKTILPKSPI
jgi:hypothetical protein